MRLVYDWLNLKFEKQWQDWSRWLTLCVKRFIVYFSVLFAQFFERDVAEKYLLL
jgi:hypothetical protein